VWPAQSDLVR